MASSTCESLLGAAVLLSLIPAVPAGGQSGSAAGFGGYTPADEAALGREAAAVIRRHGTDMTDGIDVYIRDLGRRLMTAIPPEFIYREFDDAVVVLDDPELTSVALPGGPVFISRGMVEVAPSEAALAGLIAHELSHVALRHGTAQAGAGERYQLGAITGRLIGEAFSDHAAGILERAIQFPASAYFLTYDADREREANRMTSRIMTRAGYDPRAAAAMIQTIAHQRERAGRRWARCHSVPSSEDEPAMPGVVWTEPRSPAFAVMQARLGASPPRPNDDTTHGRPAPLRVVASGVTVPSGESRPTAAGDLLRLSVPANWSRLPAGNAVVFAPEGAYRASPDGPAAVTHGIGIGVARSATGDLHGDVYALLTSFGDGNARLTWTPALRKVTIGGRRGVTTTASNVSPVTGEFEQVSVVAVHLPDGSLLYVVGVAPQDEAGVYRNAFTRVLESIQILN
ncbi:MAG: M48 family metalloprotease [Acidobacteria bacterium]|nr:M48 family metalloprotease [Acidobacteriota bacterium]